LWFAFINLDEDLIFVAAGEFTFMAERSDTITDDSPHGALNENSQPAHGAMTPVDFIT